MKYERRNLIFLKFCDSNSLHPGLCSKPTDEIVKFGNLQLFVLEKTDNSKSPYLLVINNDPSRL